MKSKFGYVGIRVTDIQRSIQFYSELLGMKVIGRSSIEQTKGETVALQCERGGPVLELNYYDKDSPYNTRYSSGESLDHLAFKVDDLDRAIEDAGKAGHPTVLEMNDKSGRWAYIHDPDGIWIELY